MFFRWWGGGGRFCEGFWDVEFDFCSWCIDVEVQEAQSKLRLLDICASDSFPSKCIRKTLDLTFMINDMTHPESMDCSGPCVINIRTRLSPVCPYFDYSSSRFWNPPLTYIYRWIVLNKLVLSLGLFLVAKWCLGIIRIVWLWNREAPWHQCFRNPIKYYCG